MLTRRYYGIRELNGVTARDVAGRRFVTAEFDSAGESRAASDALRGRPWWRPRSPRSRTCRRPSTACPTWPRRCPLAAWWPTCTSPATASRRRDGHPDADALAGHIHGLLAQRQRPLPASVERVTVTIAGTSGAAMQHHFTYRPAAAHTEGGTGQRLAEDRLIRGLHPQIAVRLQLDRLREFDLTRLPSADEEIYLVKAVAKSNRADERLVAMGQVRDLTPLREADGRLVALPALENVLAGCLDAIRSIQAQLPQHKRFDANRIMLYVWPVVDLTADEINSLVHRVRPTTSGSGLEEVQFVTRMRTPYRRARRDRRVDHPRRQPQRAAAHGAAAERADPAARRLPAEGAARRPARQRLPVRADRPAGRPGRHVHRARPG